MKKTILIICCIVFGIIGIFFVKDLLKTETYYVEDFRPQFHFTPEEKWMNDPNGMVYYEGEYHLFYQHNPHDNEWGPMYWGHAVSKDMVKWEHLDIALEPDELGTIFSGSAVVDWNDTTGFFDDSDGLVAIFTHNGDKGQQQSIAYSKDNGRTWKKFEGNPVIPNDGEIKDFRDPKVFWHEDTKKWVMAIAAGKKVMFYNSSDLIEWEYLSEFGEGIGAQGGVWETPDLFELPVDGDPDNMRWVLEVDIGDGAIAGGSGAQYFIGTFDGTTFSSDQEADEINWLDYGADFYAAQSFSDIPESDGRRIMIAWMSNWLYANQVPTESWRSATSFPRVMELKTTERGELKLFQSPVEELNNIIEESIFSIENQDVDVSDAPSLLEDIQADVFQLKAEIEMDQMVDFGFKIRKSEERAEETIIGYSHQEQEFFVQRNQTEEGYFSPYFDGRHSIPVNDEKTIDIQVLVDQSSVEVFIQDGEYVITDIIFPSDESQEIEFYLETGSVHVKSLEIQPIQSVWR